MTSQTLQTILLVEDDNRIRKLAETSLTRIGGYDVESVPNGQDIVTKVERANPDLVLLDVMMPEVDGIEVVENLTEEGLTTIPIVFFTAKIREPELKRYRQLGIAGIIEKPFEARKLPEQLEQIWLDSQSSDAQETDS